MIINKNNKEATSDDLKEKGIYKFFVKEGLLHNLIIALKIQKFINNNKIETIKFKGKGETYYCVYVGKAQSPNGFEGRIVNCHLNGSISNSTLRKFFKYIINYKKFKKTFIDECLFVIEPIDNFDKIDALELSTINSKYIRILNFDDNKFYLKNKKLIEVLLEVQKRRNPKQTKNKSNSTKNSTNSKPSTSFKTKSKTSKP